MMRPANRRWVLLVVAIAFLCGAATRPDAIDTVRQEYKLSVIPVEKAAVPKFALPLMMAGFRALIIDALWLRAVRLKEDGRFYDAYQLSSWICAMQPRFASVWAFNAWNMAYNISVTLKSPEERWRWVQNGYKLLRDEALPNNPTNTQIYRELSWIFFHKIADFMDECHWYYKNQFALEIEDILGPGGDYDWEALAAAPHAWKDLIKDPAVAHVVQEFARRKIDVSESGLFIGLLNNREEARHAATQPAQTPLAWNVLDNPDNREGLRRLEFYWRARTLREREKIEASRVVELRKRFGPLDFRMAEAHGLYWSTKGLEQGAQKALRLDVERLNTARIGELYVLQNMCRRGKLILSPEAKMGTPPLLLPNSAFVEKEFNLYLELSKQPEFQYEKSPGPIAIDFESAFKNFMRWAIVLLFQEGDKAQAQKYFDWMREHYDHPDFHLGLDYFATQTIKEQLKVLTTYDAMAMVTSHITRALSLLAYGKAPEGMTALHTARWVCDIYNSETSPRTKYSFDESLERLLQNARTQLPPEAYARLMTLFGNIAQSQPAKDSSGKP